MARAPFRPVELTEALRPVAAPVDTFIHAQEPPRDNNLQDLARSLSGLGGSLAGLVGKRDAKAEEDEKIRGEAAYWQSNGVGAAEAVSRGIIPAQASPAFLQAYKKVEGEVAGGVLEQKFASAYDTWDGKSSADPAAYEAFVGKFLKDNIATTDPDTLRGLLPKVRQFTANYLQQHIGDASKATMQGALQASAARDAQALDAANSAGLTTHKGTDYAGVFAEIERNREASLKVGMNRDQYDKQIVDGITAKAIELRDPKVLHFLERKVPGQDYTWSNTPFGRDAKQKTIDVLESMGRKSIADDEKKRREEKAAAKDDITRRTIQAITARPNEPIPEDLLAAGEKVDADFRVNAIRWRDTIGKGTQTSDNEELTHVTRQILFENGGVQAVQRAMDRGVFKNPEDLTRAYKLAESMAKDGPALDAITKLQSFRDLTNTIKKRTAADKDATVLFDDGSFSSEGLQAMTDLRLQALQWAQKNPEAGPIEREEAVAAIGASILKRIQQPETAGAVGYDRQGLGGDNTFGARAPVQQMPTEANGTGKAPTVPPPPPAFGDFGGQIPGELSVPAEAAPATSPTPARPAAPSAPAPTPPADAGAWFNGLGQDVRSAIEMKAAQEKKPLSLKVQELYEKGIAAGRITPAPAPTPGKQSGTTMRAPDGTPVEAASLPMPDVKGDITRLFEAAAARQEGAPETRDPQPNPDAVRMVSEAFERALARTSAPQGGYAAASLKDDPRAARILDFVAGPESRGNYNAFYGNAGSAKDLGAMTFDQVVNWSQSRGTASSATGRYQFMYDTMKGLKQEMGLSGSEKFTPELQDQMALRLLDRRGYQDWKAGRLSTAQFGNNLALEWASLPNLLPQRGRGVGQSAYDGDGLNKALVSPSAVKAALGWSGTNPGAAQPTDASARSQAIASGQVATLPDRKGSGAMSPANVYANIPDVDDRGQAGQRAKFLTWNPDPIGNHERNLQSLKPDLAAVFRKAQADNPGLRFVIGSGVRDAGLQKKAVEWGWSKTDDSHHLHGDAADIWVLDNQGRVIFDPKLQDQAADAVKRAASDLGVGVRWGGDFRRFKDRPHFELMKTTRA